MSFSPLVDELLDALRVLPGVGPKTAQRMALHLLERDREGGRRMTSGICSYRKSCAADGGQQIKAGMEAIMAIMQNNSKPDKDGTPPM